MYKLCKIYLVLINTWASWVENFIHQIKSNCDIPILRKDFIISEYQVWESFTVGADAILLIADTIEYTLLKDLYQLTTELGLSVLLESYSMLSLEKSLKLKPAILGINCRDLKTMKTKNSNIWKMLIN